ncbi:hypothetical protein Hamer_G022047 [Homarus americanus]|uniref:Uncharacterized protein n=1 Tax=Homarus americanus TaxID=6706 RepID=A0A8J5N9B5_HOMAM|nr:hypothetical protein Hamer_G022047 [Homarus americanus]
MSEEEKEKEKRGVWRLWAWGRKGRRRYTLRDVQSEEDVCLYKDPVPVLKKGYTSDDHLLDQRRPHAQSDDDEGESEDPDRALSIWESLAWRDDSQDSEDVSTDKDITESEVETTESESEEVKKDGGAVQTIVERLRACGAGHGRAGNLNWPNIDTWTSHDLKQFLINKAQLELGGPYDNDSVNSIEMKSYVHNNCNTLASRQVSPAPAIPTPPGATPRPVPLRPRGRGRTVASALLRRGGRARKTNQRSSMQLEHVMRDLSPPPPRPRLWSLPAIIVTTFDNPLKTPSPPGFSNSLSNSMNYLTVPNAHTYRPRQDTEDTQSEPCSTMDAIMPCVDSDKKTVPGGLASATKLGSIMDLWSGQWQVQEDREASDGRPYPSGSPPPDPRPQANPEYLQYEESFVSVALLSLLQVIGTITHYCRC